MPKVTSGALALAGEIVLESQRWKTEGRGQPEHLSICRAGAKVGLGLGTD